MKEVYHSALRDALPIEGRLDWYYANGSYVIRHDLAKGPFPDGVGVEFHTADAIYSEPPWRAGYARFMERAGHTVPEDRQAVEFVRFLSGLNDLINLLQVPTYLVMGKHMLKYLHPDHVQDLKLNGGDAIIGLWNASEVLPWAASEDVLTYVADHYSRVLDPCCGYGNVARAMAQRGKRFICTDVNPHCLYYVAVRYMGYAG